MRILALAINGGWNRTPVLRFFGALIGMMWWITLFYLYTTAMRAGAQVFPSILFYPIFSAFEAYSLIRCGQDAHAMDALKRSKPGAR